MYLQELDTKTNQFNFRVNKLAEAANLGSFQYVSKVGVPSGPWSPSFQVLDAQNTIEELKPSEFDQPTTSRVVMDEEVQELPRKKTEFSKQELLGDVLPPTMATVTAFKNFLVIIDSYFMLLLWFIWMLI